MEDWQFYVKMFYLKGVSILAGHTVTVKIEPIYFFGHTSSGALLAMLVWWLVGSPLWFRIKYPRKAGLPWSIGQSFLTFNEIPITDIWYFSKMTVILWLFNKHHHEICGFEWNALTVVAWNLIYSFSFPSWWIIIPLVILWLFIPSSSTSCYFPNTHKQIVAC